jgi:hypothetical protein
VAQSKGDLLDAVNESRTGRSLWLSFLLAGLGLLVIESLLANLMHKRPGGRARQSSPTTTQTGTT